MWRWKQSISSTLLKELPSYQYQRKQAPWIALWRYTKTALHNDTSLHWLVPFHLQLLASVEEIAVELILSESLTTSPTPVSRVSIHHITTQLTKVNDNLDVKGRLGKFLIKDTRPDPSHPLILTTDIMDDFITAHFKLVKFTPRPARFGRAAIAAAVAPKSTPADQTDIYLGLKIQTMSVVVVKEWVDDVIRVVHQISDATESIATDSTPTAAPGTTTTTATTTTAHAKSAANTPLSTTSSLFLIRRQFIFLTACPCLFILKTLHTKLSPPNHGLLFPNSQVYIA